MPTVLPGLGLARDLPPYTALAIQGVSKGNDATPYATAAVMPFRIAVRAPTVLKMGRGLRLG
jgi:hypothetical protein